MNQDLVSTASTSQGTFAVHATGATVTKWDSATFGPLLFLSGRSARGLGEAIRGGVPICFPWFGVPRPDELGAQMLGRERALAKHGFARQAIWRRTADAEGHDGAWVVRYELNQEDVLASEALRGGGPTVLDASVPESAPQVALSSGSEPVLAHAVTGPNGSEREVSRALQPFEAELEAVFSDVLLDLTFTVRNPGEQPFVYESALHAYLAVGDVAQTEIIGLGGAEYIDKVGSDRVLTQAGPLTFGPETDRVFPSTAPVDVIDHLGGRRIRVVKENSGTTVIWNPGSELAGQIGDLEDADWRRFVCVEVANAYESAVTLAPGEQHVMRARYEVSSL